MSYALIDTTDLTALGNAIRTKTGGSSAMTVSAMATAVAGITSGGGGGWAPSTLHQDVSFELVEPEEPEEGEEPEDDGITHLIADLSSYTSAPFMVIAWWDFDAIVGIFNGTTMSWYHTINEQDLFVEDYTNGVLTVGSYTGASPEPPLIFT